MKIGKRVRCFADNWRGKVRRIDLGNTMALIEWTYCGGFPTDICTWVSFDDIASNDAGGH